MKTQSGRLIELINQLNLNTRSFALNCGFSQPTTIYSVIKNDSKLTISTLDKICNRFPQVNKDWLLTGYGNMFNSSSEKEPLSDELTVTAKQVIDTIVPKMLRHDLVTKAELLIEELHKTVLKFNTVEVAMNLQNQKLEAIHKKINSLERMQAVEIIKEAKKKRKNGGLDLN